MNVLKGFQNVAVGICENKLGNQQSTLLIADLISATPFLQYLNLEGLNLGPSGFVAIMSALLFERNDRMSSVSQHQITRKNYEDKPKCNDFNFLNFSKNNISPEDIDIISKCLQEKVKEIIKFQYDPVQLGANFDWRNQLGVQERKTQDVNLNVIESVSDLINGKINKICLTQLDLSNNQLTGCKLDEFVYRLSVYTNIQRINLTNCHFFQSKPKKNKNTESLRMKLDKDGNINRKGFRPPVSDQVKFFESMSRNLSLSLLDLSHNKFLTNDVTLEYLFAYEARNITAELKNFTQHNKRLITLNLSHCQIGDAAAGGLFEGLTQNQNSVLENLILVDNHIEQKSVIDSLIPLLAKGTVPEEKMSKREGKRNNSRFVRSTESQVNHNSCICNSIKGTKKYYSKLKTLNLAMNQIPDGAGEKLALILRSNNVLTDLNLSNNLLKDNTASKLLNILTNNFTLQSITLDRNSMSQQTKDKIQHKLL